MTGHDEHDHDHDHSHQDHGHGHGHSHSHAVAADADRRWLAIALALIVVFMAGEVVVGLSRESLALISDAAHMLTDAGLDRAGADRDAAGRPAGPRRLHLRPQAGRDPLRAGQRRHPAGAVGLAGATRPSGG